MDKRRSRPSLNPGEVIVVILILIGFIYLWAPWRGKTIRDYEAFKQVSNAKQILTGCALFAADMGAGRYPNGHYDAKTGEITSDIPAESAEACFQDLFDAGIMDMEVLFWLADQEKQCAKEKPDEDGILEPGENYWDYVSGLESVRDSTLPLIFQASDEGKGMRWTTEGGHPWIRSVVVGYTDGSSARKEYFRENGRVVDANGVDKFVPTPGENGWPEGAAIAPATKK